MWLARVLTDGTYMTCEIDPNEVESRAEHLNWYVTRRKPRLWPFTAWSGSGWAAIDHNRSRALETAFGAFTKRAA